MPRNSEHVQNLRPSWGTLRTLLTALCFLLVLPFPAFATSIVALIGEDSITIAADSLHLGIPIETGETVRHSRCKILCVHHFCFAASGSFYETSTGYDVFGIAKRELRHHGSLEELAERFGTVVEPLVAKLVALIQKKTPHQYTEWLGGIPVFEYLFAGFDSKGKPLAVGAQAIIDTEGRALPIRPTVWRANPVEFGLSY